MSKLVLAVVIALALVLVAGGVLVVAAATGGTQGTLSHIGQSLPVLHLGAPAGGMDKGSPSVKPLNRDDDEERGIYCNQDHGKDAKKHPAGERLAERFEVAYAEVMKRFCGGLGFGEIALGYKIAEAAGVDADEVFARRSDGMSWGQIKKDYDLKGKPPDKIKDQPKKQDDNKPGNGNNKNNKNKNNKNNKKKP